MNNEFIDILRKKLDVLIYSNKLADKYIVLFGANSPGDEVINYLAQQGIEVKGIIDNNVGNKGKKMLGVPIYLPEDLLKNYKDEVVVLICSRYYSEMREQLEQMGYKNNKHIIKLLDMNSNMKYTTSIIEFIKESSRIILDIRVYNKLIKKYDENINILVCPTKANGDVYLIGGYIRQYLDKRKLKKYVLIVIGRGCYKVAELFGLENIEQLSQKEVDSLVRLNRLVGNINIKVFQPYYMYTSVLNSIEGYKGNNFGDLFKYGVFSLEERAILDEPIYKSNSEYIKQLFAEKNLKVGNTVILSPYANSLPGVKWEFWTQLAWKLKQNGYVVCTNSIGEKEPPIPGTTSICFDIRDMIGVLETAGIFIALRSGLCDVVSSANCRQVIIYPEKAIGFSKVIDVYGIKAMGLAENIFEIEFKEDIAYMQTQILDYIASAK